MSQPESYAEAVKKDAEDLMVNAAREARLAGHPVSVAFPCPWCGQSVNWDPENWFAEKKDHEKNCPQIKEWERCKE